MKKIIKIAPIVSCLFGICLLFGILATFYGNVIYDLFAFHSKPFYCWHYFSGTFMHGSKEAPVWFIWVHLVLNALMLIPFGGLLEWKRGSKYVFFVFITSMVISSIVFHVLTQDRDIQASGVSAVGYAFVTGGVLNMFDIWKNLSVITKISYILLLLLSIIMLLPNITGWLSTFLHISGIVSYLIVSVVSNYHKKIG